jgi:hypothetical protein
MTCKSYVSVNHLHLHDQIFYLTLVLFLCIMFFTLTSGQSKYLSYTLTQSCVDVCTIFPSMTIPFATTY